MTREDDRDIYGGLCTCGIDADGQDNTDGCVLHDMPLSGLLIGEPQ